MSLRLVIDGYNFIGQTSGLTPRLQGDRDALIDRLSDYEKVKGIPVSVVFDGWKEGHASQTRAVEKGIEVIFSRQGEKADQVIIRLIKSLRERAIVVSSDREIRDWAAREGAVSLTVREFQAKMEEARRSADEDREDDGEEGSFRKEKKGNANRLSKKERAKKIKLKKL
jgi:hypothetical protein